MNYHSIHCPYCGEVFEPTRVKFSITDFVQEIYAQRLERKFNDGVLGEIDEENINLIIDNDFLWDMSADEIEACYEGDKFVLAGDSILKRFGQDVIEMMHAISMTTLEKTAESMDVNGAMRANSEVWNLVGSILRKIPEERLFRTEVENEDRNIAVLNLVMFAKSGKTLFKVGMKIQPDTDDIRNADGEFNIIAKDIRTPDNRIICKSKKCFNCGNSLSKMAGKYEEKIIAFIGSPAAGKTAYLTAVVSKLMMSGQQDYNIQLIFDYESGDYINFNKTCLEPYSKGFAISKTNRDAFPQLSMALQNIATNKTFLYTFVDMPGETFIDKEGCDVTNLLVHRGVIKYADVFWFCVSAKQLFDNVIEFHSDGASEGQIANEEMKDLNILGANTISVAQHLFDGTAQKPAVALILTKADLLTNFVAENMFDGDEVTNKQIKQDLFEKICPAPQENNQFDEEFIYTDGEPTTLDYIYNGMLNYKRLLNGSKKVAEFIKSYGQSFALPFLQNIATAFDKEACPCFSEASYGRSPVVGFSLEGAVRFLLERKESLHPQDWRNLTNIFGEEALNALISDGKPLPTPKESEVAVIKGLYRRLNPTYPFGIMMPLVWTFAYTGLMECVKASDNGGMQSVDTYGQSFENIRKELSSLPSSKFSQATDIDQDQNKKKKKTGFKLF